MVEKKHWMCILIVKSTYKAKDCENASVVGRPFWLARRFNKEAEELKSNRSLLLFYSFMTAERSFSVANLPRQQQKFPHKLCFMSPEEDARTKEVRIVQFHVQFFAHFSTCIGRGLIIVEVAVLRVPTNQFWSW